MKTGRVNNGLNGLNRFQMPALPIRRGFPTSFSRLNPFNPLNPLFDFLTPGIRCAR
jgi:hypothetical protein